MTVLLLQNDGETAAYYSVSAVLEFELDERFQENVHDFFKPHEKKGSDIPFR
jgi:hypothetical protein